MGYLYDICDIGPESHISDTPYARERVGSRGMERTAAAASAGAMGADLCGDGPRRGGPAAAHQAGLGGLVACWTFANTSGLSNARGWVMSVLERAPGLADDWVHEASAESFPASDAPSWTPTVGTSPHSGDNP